MSSTRYPARLALAVGGVTLVRSLALIFLAFDASWELSYVHRPYTAAVETVPIVLSLAVLISGGRRLTLQRRLLAALVAVLGVAVAILLTRLTG